MTEELELEPVSPDLFLRFTDEAQATSILFDEDETPRYRNTDIIGIIFEPTGNTIETDEGPVPEMAPISGWHVNIRLADGEDGEALEPYQVFPTQPRRVWA